MLGGLAIADGPAFGVAGDRLFVADSLADAVLATPLDPVTGRVGTSATFWRVGGRPGTCDGMTVDAEDHLLVALHGAGAIVRLAAEARLVGELPVPAAGPTSLAFGSDDLQTLFVTVAHGAWPADRGGRMARPSTLPVRPAC